MTFLSFSWLTQGFSGNSGVRAVMGKAGRAQILNGLTQNKNPGVRVRAGQGDKSLQERLQRDRNSQDICRRGCHCTVRFLITLDPL